MSIIHPGNRSPDKWFKQRPLYKFLDSDINKKNISSVENLKKSDIVNIKGRSIYCNSVRNNYDVIHYLIKHKLNFDATDIIVEDKNFIKDIFSL